MNGMIQYLVLGPNRHLAHVVADKCPPSALGKCWCDFLTAPQIATRVHCPDCGTTHRDVLQHRAPWGWRDHLDPTWTWQHSQRLINHVMSIIIIVICKGTSNSAFLSTFLSASSFSGEGPTKVSKGIWTFIPSGFSTVYILFSENKDMAII